MSTNLSATEKQLLELFWNAGKPLSRQELLERTEGRSWNPSSIHLILNSMISKNVIRITDVERRYGRTYEAIVTREDYLAQLVENALPEASPKDRLLHMVAALVRRDGISGETIQELEAFLAQQTR